jgi:hypothetical protein
MLDQSFAVNPVGPPRPRGGETAQAAWPHPDHNEPSPCRWHPQAGWPYHSHDEPSPGLSPRDLGRLAAVRPHSPLPPRSRLPSVTGQPRPGLARTLPPDIPVGLSPPPRRMAARGAPDRPRSVTAGSPMGLAGIFTGAPTGSAQTGGPPPELNAPPGSIRLVPGKASRQPAPSRRLWTGALEAPLKKPLQELTVERNEHSPVL